MDQDIARVERRHAAQEAVATELALLKNALKGKAQERMTLTELAKLLGMQKHHLSRMLSNTDTSTRARLSVDQLLLIQELIGQSSPAERFHFWSDFYRDLMPASEASASLGGLRERVASRLDELKGIPLAEKGFLFVLFGREALTRILGKDNAAKIFPASQYP